MAEVGGARALCIYVSRDGQANLAVGLQHGTWGFRRDHSSYGDVKPGDLVVLGTGHTGGSVRVQLGEWTKHSLQRVIVGRISSSVHKEDVPLWADEIAAKAGVGNSQPFQALCSATSEFSKVYDRQRGG